MIRWETIEHESGGRTLAIYLARPEKRNALTPEMLREITSVGMRVKNDSQIHCVLLAGEGDVFCAGFDLSLCRDDSSVMAALLSDLAHAARALRALTMPVVCAAPGAAIAGGCALLAACDFAVTDATAKIGYPVVRLGLSPAVSGPMLAPAIGAGSARARMLDPALISGTHALALGLVSDCVGERAEVHSQAVSICESLAAKPPASLSRTKQWISEIDGSLDMSINATALETSLQTARTQEFRDGLAEVWKGR